MKRAVGFLAALVLIGGLARPCWGVELTLSSHAALLMEKTTGQILYAQNEHDALLPASVTKIMTVLLTMEAISSGRIALDDTVTVSAYAAGMGGSQVFLAEGEQITVDDLLKAVCVASGNDAAVALAEHVAGVTELFVEQMNNRARELGMNDTHFVNCTGLTAEGHVTSAHDIALMSRELLLHHPEVRNYTTIWMDTLRDGTFGLSNTNKLIRFYDGATGLKTGFTREAGYCISATAERDDRRYHEGRHCRQPQRRRQGPAELWLFHLYAGGCSAPGAPGSSAGDAGGGGQRDADPAAGGPHPAGGEEPRR